RAARPDRADDGSEMSGPAIVEVVTVDGGDDHMLQPELRRCQSNAGGLTRVKCAGQPRFDIAECAGARACVAHDHEGCVLFFPTFPYVRASRLLAHSVQSMSTHDRARLGIAFRERRLDPNPG